MVELPQQEEDKKGLNPPVVSPAHVNWLTNVVYTILAVMSLAFITLLFNYYQQSASSYEDLRGEIIETNIKIDLLYNMMTDNKNIQVTFPSLTR